MGSPKARRVAIVPTMNSATRALNLRCFIACWDVLIWKPPRESNPLFSKRNVPIHYAAKRHWCFGAVTLRASRRREGFHSRYWSLYDSYVCAYKSRGGAWYSYSHRHSVATLRPGLIDLLPHKGSNLGFQSQSLTCFHYTMWQNEKPFKSRYSE